MATEPKNDEATAPATDIRGLNIYQKLAAITGDIGIVDKGGNNTEQKYKFIEYEAIAGKLRALFAQYGVVIVPQVKSQERAEITSKYGSKGVHTLAKMTFDVVNADKPDDRFTVEWESEAADFGDKATNKAVTAAVKYYLMRQFNISSKGDEDADAASPEIAGSGNAAPAPAAAPAPVEDKQISAAQVKYLSQILIQKKIATPQQRLAIVAAGTGSDPSDTSFDIKTLKNSQVQELIKKLNAATTEQLLAMLTPSDSTPAANDEQGEFEV